MFNKIGRYFLNIIIVAFDLQLNVILGGAPYETISSRIGKLAVQGKSFGLRAERFIDFFFGAGHCRKNIQPFEGAEAVIR